MAKLLNSISKLTEPISKVSQATEDERLGTVLNLTHSSHEPIFIFDNDKNFLGLNSSTFSLFKRQLPLNTKAGSAISVPPHINKSASINDTVNNMLSTRFYTLPVFNESKKPIAIIKAERIFRFVTKSPDILRRVAKNLKIKKPITISPTKKVKDAYELLKSKKVSRLIITDKEGKLAGMVTRHDLKNAFVTPSPRQRFSKSGGDHGQSMFDEEHVRRSDLPLINFIRNGVLTMESNSTNQDIIKKFVQSRKTSLILVNSLYHPVGLISNRDILLAISNLDDEIDIPILIKKPKQISAAVVDEIENKLIEIGKKLTRILPVERIEISFKEGKNGIGRTNLTEVILSVKFFSGHDFVVTSKNREILMGVRQAIDKIYKMTRRTKDKLQSKTSGANDF